MPISFVNHSLAVFTLGAHLFLILGGLYFLLSRRSEANHIISFFRRNSLALAFIVTLASTAASLFYSEVAGFEPCYLCWFQRIFMYPQVVLLGMALARKEFKIVNYSLVLALLGGLVSLYHNYIYYGGSSPLPCNAFGLGASCLRVYVLEFGYITIPLMALTGFLLLIFFLLLARSHYKNSLLSAALKGKDRERYKNKEESD